MCGSTRLPSAGGDARIFVNSGRTIVADDPLNRAMELHQSGKLDEAERLYQEMLTARPDDADVLHLLGLVALQRGQIDPAIRSISAAIRANDKPAIFHANLGEAYRAAGQLAAAKASYQSALALAPGLELARNNLGLSQLELEEFADAHRTFQQLVKSHPGNAQAQFNLGNACQAAGFLGEAIAAYNQAIALAPGLAAAHHQLGVVASRSSDVTTMLSDVSSARCSSIRNRLFRSAPRWEFRCTWQAGYLKPRPSIAAISKSHRTMPPRTVNLATVLHMARQLAEAETEYRRAAELGVSNVELYQKLGDCLHEQGKLAAAADVYRQAIALNPAMPEPHFHLGAVLLSQGDFCRRLARAESHSHT